MNLQRKLTLVVATGAVALGAGHFVQKRAEGRIVAEGPPVVVSSVVPVAAGPVEMTPASDAIQPPVLPAEAAPEVVQAVEPPAPSEGPVLQEIAAADPVLPVPPQIEPPPAMVAEPDCAVKLDLLPQPGAMVGITLLAPCNPDERVVLRHAGLAVTGKTSASGAMFAALPALTAVATVEAAFGEGAKVEATLPVEGFDGIQRFAVQWQDADAFQLHAFENGAGYNQPGHISAAYTGKLGESGVLTLLGDATTDLPLLAEVYTFGPDAKAELVLEAAVTEGTCSREILGETILARNGSVEITDLTMAMPDCDAVGDILVLKNLLQDMTLAAAN